MNLREYTNWYWTKSTTKISQKFELNQWKNTEVVLNWFKQINNRNFYKFATFDTKKCYPSFKECLLKNAMNFAEQHTKISEKYKGIIFHSRKSLLLNNQHVWIKRKVSFDVTMGAFDGVEVCETVSNFLLYQLSKNHNKKDIGLYRGIWLAIFKNFKNFIHKNKKIYIWKYIPKLFKDNHLNIIIQCNLKIVNYLICHLQSFLQAQ